ncbi:spore germination protein [Paenibacillus sp. JX-17]|uniref:Spore germination protein n=1 Tax=Paenibacillus lacisoli TaxID=3064525 RepID=A0ABT9CCX5_9BACL|nr:spore germination protein [Paenibacillus sp. JX-17]MDO7906428.1 spore germination protein [Paenibacillus sp. JX-17]
MIRYRSIGSRRSSSSAGGKGQGPSGSAAEMTANLEEMLQRIQNYTGGSQDVVIRRLQVGSPSSYPAAVIFLESMAKQDYVDRSVVHSLLGIPGHTAGEQADDAEQMFRHMQAQALAIGHTQIHEDWKAMMNALLNGQTLVFLDGIKKVIGCSTFGVPERSVAEPTTQLVIRGPKDSFVESIFTNISLIRRRIRNAALRTEMFQVGFESRTGLLMVYVEGIADAKIVDEARKRIERIGIDAVFDSGQIEEMIEDQSFTPFPTVYNTERPDAAAYSLIEGRVVLIVDGSPFVLVVPTGFAHFFKSTADYAERFAIAIFMRLIRYMSFIILVLGPSLYIALTTYHYEMIPTPLLISLLAQRETVPFPAFIEAMLLEIAFEILREAGVRMPRAVGQTVSIVGALVLGQAAVDAGIVTPLLTIVVALTGIASFALPSYDMSVAGRLFRFMFMVLAAVFGLYGVTLGLIAMVAHMNSLRSFGVPYMMPFSPFVAEVHKDTVLRFPTWAMRNRPRLVASKIKREVEREASGSGQQAGGSSSGAGTSGQADSTGSSNQQQDSRSQPDSESQPSSNQGDS